MQCSSGDSSSFYYKTKLNCLNFTIVELLKKRDKNQEENTESKHKRDIGAYGDVYSFFWDETQGKRGSSEIGSCLLKYLEILNAKHQGQAIHVTFYSDNCCGQNKNKYVACLYSYAGHTQNEGDNVHSLIEKEIQRNKKAGPIHAPCQYVTLIKNSRKNGKPLIVQELTYDFFWDLKMFQEKWAYNFSENENKAIGYVRVQQGKHEKQKEKDECYRRNFYDQSILPKTGVI
uniref:SFRICE_014554 n=1 Tax=Spodoptera frugiperda TaxID=7108 RepID=A0A2H1VPK2_SPOFR